MVQVRILVMSLMAMSAIAEAETQVALRVGEARLISVKDVQGVVLDDPALADVQIASRGQVRLVARRPGRGVVDTFASGGKRGRFAIDVTGAPGVRYEDDAEDEQSWGRPRYGGQRLAGARCAEPFTDSATRMRFENAMELLRRGETQDAITALEEVTRREPANADPHLVLGAALAKAREQKRGLAAYETFVLSCAEDPRAPAVVEILRAFSRSSVRR